MTKEEAKQIIADDHGFKCWDDLISTLTESNELTLMKIYIDDLMDIYSDGKIYDEIEKPYEEI